MESHNVDPKTTMEASKAPHTDVATPTSTKGKGLFSLFSPQERRNLAIYIAGIMCYKFALEYFNGGFITLANERFGSSRFAKIGILTGLNSAMQCVGSILIAPLIKKFPTRSVLSVAVLSFGLISAILLIVDASTGGRPKFMTPNNVNQYGSWNPNGLFPIYIISGVAYGMVELIRRVIPRDIVGGDVHKLRRMDAIVHVLYEVAGTAGAFTSTALIQTWGYNYSSFLSPILFSCAALVWRFISNVQEENRLKELAANGGKDLAAFEKESTPSRGFFGGVYSAFHAFFKATYYGAAIVFTDRKYIWLVPGYSVALYGHRYLENGLAPIFARQVIGVSAYSQIIVGGSNFGELLGALSVLLMTNRIPTPIPWLRLDAILLNLVWVMPFLPVTRMDINSAWKLAAIFIPISYGWAAGDVSLAAYIQSSLAKMESKDTEVSALGAVMAFLYVTYIVLYAVLSAVLGQWVDGAIARGASGRDVLKYVGGVQMTILAVVVISATFIPRGAVSFNPPMINDDTKVFCDEDSIGDEKSIDLKKERSASEDEHEYEQKKVVAA